ncbi:hypothetical protein, partial [Chryseobacterium sp. CH1]|uniref:hypothetical protein n=1 Tax=Chryseobacterium sp. CH1 TaxID=713551 RepID=UPI0010254C8C
GERIPNTANAWSDRFRESFLGEISTLFIDTPDTPYRNSLNISAFVPSILVNLGERIPNTANAWSDRFRESFLGEISTLFIDTPDT